VCDSLHVNRIGKVCVCVRVCVCVCVCVCARVRMDSKTSACTLPRNQATHTSTIGMQHHVCIHSHLLLLGDKRTRSYTRKQLDKLVRWMYACTYTLTHDECFTRDETVSVALAKDVTGLHLRIDVTAQLEGAFECVYT
jgi:hypothetical protein